MTGSKKILIVNDDPDALTVMSVTLQAAGFRVGTGDSRFGWLKEFPIDRLEIDRSFVQHVHSNSDDYAIASAIIAKAKTLKREVVAEGVDDFAQLMVLQNERCAMTQGFLLSRPLPVTAAQLLLHRPVAKADGARTERRKRLLA